MDLSATRKPTPPDDRVRDAVAVGSLPRGSFRRTAGSAPRTRISDNVQDELRLCFRVEAISRHLRAIGHHAEALAVENLGVMIEMFAEKWRPRPQ